MARTANEILSDMLEAKSGLPALKDLTNTSTTSIWRLLLYVAAAGMSNLEKLLDSHKAEVDEMIAGIVPGKAEWYAKKALQYMDGYKLSEDTDTYDTTGMSEEDIEKARIVKHAVATESKETSQLVIKVAGEKDGERCPIAEDAAERLAAYMNEIKYAGVRIELVNKQADSYRCKLVVYYNPQLSSSAVEGKCRGAIKAYVENLPFNGNYENMAMTDAIQAVDGVRTAEFKSAEYCPADGNTWIAITEPTEAQAGYFQTEDDDMEITMKPYEKNV